HGPVPVRPLGSVQAPFANSGRLGLLLIPALILAILLVAGGGRSLTLLPSDPIVRVTLAPALGVAVISVAALAWDRAGLSLRGNLPLVPVALSAASGWAAAVLVRFRRRTSERARG